MVKILHPKKAWDFYLPDKVSESDEAKFKHFGFFLHLLYMYVNEI